MDTIKKSSFTLVEIAVSMALAGILALAISSQFLAMARFKTVIENKAEPSREAFIVLDHMTRVLRFVSSYPTPPFASDASTDLLTANIESGHIALIPATTPVTIPPSATTCYYRRYRTTSLKNFLYFQIGENSAPQLLSKYVTYFDASIAGDEITLKLIFSKGGTVTPVQTKIRMLVQ
ncbi:MAG: prepilin-type N-terminal cleavage/methylation domain-containing protein [Candidatus Omnitrophota bacterium]|nr:prepilin-type N-terminal cleavage/methylation domain-containing protein [Candidatus Omnitrophota bacterium]